MPAKDYTAIVLAAGYGSRIAEVTEDPKILLPINDKPILHRHLEIFANLGIKNVVLVVGFRKQMIIDAVQPFTDRLNIKFVSNDDYTRLGNGYSLFFGIQNATGPSLIFDGDLVYAKDILARFAEDDHANAVLVSTGSLDDIESAKTLVDEQNNVRKTIDKRAVTAEELAQYKFAGESIGVLKFDEAHRQELVELCEKFFSDEANLLLNWEHIMSVFFQDHDVWNHFDESDASIEIDTAEDYREACRKFANSSE
ncbi:MAG: choline kinase [Candidatus Binatia bacterium]|jgi:choline kinase